jgi:hypothetical protein
LFETAHANLGHLNLADGIFGCLGHGAIPIGDTRRSGKMPPVDVAMAQSLRRGFLDLFVASLQPAIQRRSLTDQINDVSTAFSSWDNCMLVDYCKYVLTVGSPF